MARSVPPEQLNFRGVKLPEGKLHLKRCSRRGAACLCGYCETDVSYNAESGIATANAVADVGMWEQPARLEKRAAWRACNGCEGYQPHHLHGAGESLF